MTGPAKSSLSKPRQQIVEWMQLYNFGRIENLTFRGGEPILDPQPRIVRAIKLGGDNRPRPERHFPDCVLKSQLVELFQHLDQLQDGVIAVLEFQHGLPFRFEVTVA
ncbi:MAG: hypothetical protein LC104_04905 [Bacteroidales bacterium]|nr:hypothetical protein [Bacteroidales bacterium]